MRHSFSGAVAVIPFRLFALGLKLGPNAGYANCCSPGICRVSDVCYREARDLSTDSGLKTATDQPNQLAPFVTKVGSNICRPGSIYMPWKYAFIVSAVEIQLNMSVIEIHAQHECR